MAAPVRFAVVGLGDIAQRAVLPAFEHARRKAVLAALVSAAREGEADIRILDAIDRSAKTGRAVRLRQVPRDQFPSRRDARAHPAARRVRVVE